MTDSRIGAERTNVYGSATADSRIGAVRVFAYIGPLPPAGGNIYRHGLRHRVY